MTAQTDTAWLRFPRALNRALPRGGVDMIGSKPVRRGRRAEVPLRLHWPRIFAALFAILLCGGFWLLLASCAVDQLAVLPMKPYRGQATAPQDPLLDEDEVFATLR